MAGNATSVTTALARLGTRLRTGIVRGQRALTAVARLDTHVQSTVELLATHLAAGWVGLVAGDVGHLGLATHALLGDQHDARRAGFAVRVARVASQ